MTTTIIDVAAPVCHTCMGRFRVPDPQGTGWITCPACGGDDGLPAEAALPADGPVGTLDVWAVAEDEGAAMCVSHGRGDRADAESVACLSAQILSGHPRYRGGEVRVCDEQGHTWRREPIGGLRPLDPHSRAAA